MLSPGPWSHQILLKMERHCEVLEDNKLVTQPPRNTDGIRGLKTASLPTIL